MHCDTITHCNALQRTATHCIALQRTATHCNALQRTATHCIALQRATHYNAQQTATRSRGLVLEVVSRIHPSASNIET